MSALKYSILCEDKAHYNFITTFLEIFANEKKVRFSFDELFFKRFRASNSKEVLKKYVNASVFAFRDYDLDFLVIGIDYDDRCRNDFYFEIDKLYGKLDDNFSDKSIIMFPVQAIEHWLLYISYHVNNPKSTKNISYEQIPRRAAKHEIYKHKYAPDTLAIVTQLVQKIDISWLISHSESFKKFYADLKIKLTV